MRALLERDPADFDAKRRLADLLSWKKEYAESIRLFEELKKAKPDDAVILLRLAEVTLWSKDVAKALLLFQGLPRIGPASAVPPRLRRRCRGRR